MVQTGTNWYKVRKKWYKVIEKWEIMGNSGKNCDSGISLNSEQKEPASEEVSKFHFGLKVGYGRIWSHMVGWTGPQGRFTRPVVLWAVNIGDC